MLRPVRKSSSRFPVVAVSPNTASCSRYASRPASLVNLLPTNVSLTVRSKSTRKSHYWQSPIRFPLRRAGIGRKSLTDRGHAQIPGHSARGHLGNTGFPASAPPEPITGQGRGNTGATARPTSAGALLAGRRQRPTLRALGLGVLIPLIQLRNSLPAPFFVRREVRTGFIRDERLFSHAFHDPPSTG